MMRIAIPLASGGLGAAAAVAFARGIGEFGATILFAGSFQGSTQTLPLAVYSLFDANLDQAVAIGVLLIIISAAILLSAKLLAPLMDPLEIDIALARRSFDLRAQLTRRRRDGRARRTVRRR